MKHYELKKFVRGWFVGGFDPSIIKTKDVEVAVQHFKAGDKEDEHCHKIATEVTCVVAGRAKLSGKLLGPGDIVEIPPGEYSNFEALEDTITVVVKYPGALNDKYLR